VLAAGNCQSDINVEPDASLPLFGCSNTQHDYSYSICVFFDVGIMFHRHRYRNHSSASLLSSHYHHYRPRTGAIVGHFHLSESHGYWCQSFDDHCGLLLATGPGNRPAVQVLAGGSVQFGSRPGQKPDPLHLGGFITRTRHIPGGFWPGWNWPAITTLCFRNLGLQSSI